MEQGEGQGTAAGGELHPQMPQVDQKVINLFGSFQSGANWFFWIAGLSAVNSIVILSGADLSFLVGLGVTLVIDAVAREIGGMGIIVAIVLDLLVILIFVGVGVFARKRHTWAFTLGMILYGLDGLLFLFFQDWLSLGFHVFALYCIVAGLRAHLALKRMALAAAGEQGIAGPASKP